MLVSIMLIRDINASNLTTTTTILLYNIVGRCMDKLFSQKRTPIWFMRQAGRYLPEYKNTFNRKNFLDLCFNWKAARFLCNLIERFDLDFIILFSDILVVPHALGQFVDFKENLGPVLEPINNKHD